MAKYKCVQEPNAVKPELTINGKAQLTALAAALSAEKAVPRSFGANLNAHVKNVHRNTPCVFMLRYPTR